MHVQERENWQQKAEAQLRSAVAAAEMAVEVDGMTRAQIDAEFQYQAQQVLF
jgi:hypothetical protein